MKKEVCVLHISDLHKSEGQTYDNLLTSLKLDSDSYVEKEGIRKPEIIVISGDLIQGSKKVSGASAEIRQQYAEVSVFLTDLVNEFLDGDKSRLIMVPGNHDMNRSTSQKSMSESDKDKEQDYELYRRSNDDIRWSWKTFSFHGITNRKTYSKRFDEFRKFYNDFYNGIRRFPDDAEMEGYLVELKQYHIAFACFNSCHKLDHLNTMGSISPSALSSIRMDIDRCCKKGFLIVGVWHHHVSGLPCESNYLDYRILNAMTGLHISVGMYGHQHAAEILQESKDISEDSQPILLVSSGTLYGGRNEQVDGHPRQYNLIELGIDRGKADLTLHVRKDDSVASYAIPNWHISPIGNKAKASFHYSITLNNCDEEDIIPIIDSEARKTKDYYTACMDLLDLDIQNVLVRKYFDEYFEKLSLDQQEKISENGVYTQVQYMNLLNAFIETRNYQGVSNLLKTEYNQYHVGPVLAIVEDAKRLLKWQKK